MVKDTCPGMTLVAPGTRIDVADGADQAVRSVRQNSSIATMHSAAPASASRRSAIGTVPAWPAMPVSAASRVAPAIAVTTPTGRFSFQHRTLLDVQFDIGQQFAAARAAAPI